MTFETKCGNQLSLNYTDQNSGISLLSRNYVGTINLQLKIHSKYTQDIHSKFHIFKSSMCLCYCQFA